MHASVSLMLRTPWPSSPLPHSVQSAIWTNSLFMMSGVSNTIVQAFPNPRHGLHGLRIETMRSEELVPHRGPTNLQKSTLGVRCSISIINATQRKTCRPRHALPSRGRRFGVYVLYRFCSGSQRHSQSRRSGGYCLDNDRIWRNLSALVLR